MIIVAQSHLKNARVTGGISWITFRATMKLPDQTIVANTASAMPVSIFSCLIELLFIKPSKIRYHFLKSLDIANNPIIGPIARIGKTLAE